MDQPYLCDSFDLNGVKNGQKCLSIENGAFIGSWAFCVCTVPSLTEKMAAIIREMVKTYHYVFNELPDPRVESLPLMRSPLPLLGLLCFYLYFVFKLGPKLMKNRPAFDLEKVIIVFNSVQIVACFYIVVQYVRYILFSYSLFCQPIDFSDEGLPFWITRHVYLYFVLKLADLCDTIFFVLRKRDRQISFLHVYHHTGMCLLGWSSTKYVAGGHSVFIGFINCIVHVIMYFYYLLSAWNKEYKKSIWWKKYITQVQIVQFLIIIIYFVQLLFQPNCNYPKYTVWIFVPQNIFMIVLFTDFYIKNYIKKPKSEQTGAEKIKSS